MAAPPPGPDAAATVTDTEAPDAASSDGGPADGGPADGGPAGTVLPPPPPPDDGLAAVCARGQADPVSAAFCGATKPSITGLAALEALVGLGFVPGDLANGDRDHDGVLAATGNPAFALTANSSSLVARFVSAVNPRAIVFTPTNRLEPPVSGYVALGFTRGEQFVELVSHDTAKDQLRFFLFRFQQACNADPAGCGKADLLTPAIERGFTSWSLVEDVDLEDTPFDCLQCHQPDGAGTKKILRMQELQNPWTHWLRDHSAGPGDDPTGGQLLLAQYQAAHGSEDYAGIPGAAIHSSDPRRLEGLMENAGFATQPNEFVTKAIEGEVVQSNVRQPQVNVPPGVSAGWQRLYEQAVAGLAIPPPYHDVQVTDPDKLRAFTAAYPAVARGDRSAAAALPDPSEMFLPAARADLSFAPKPGLDGVGILMHMCEQCHRSALNQRISRARFDVMRLVAGQLSSEERVRAVARLRLPADSPIKMPPPRFRALSDTDIAAATEALLR